MSIEVNLSSDPIYRYVGPLPMFGFLDLKGKPHLVFDCIVANVYKDRFEEMDPENDKWFNPSTMKGTKKDIQSIILDIEDTSVHELIHSIGEIRDEDVVERMTMLLVGCTYNKRRGCDDPINSG
jgi:hypothetical protein